MPNPLAHYHQATKSWPAAILLFQIAYWMPKAKVRRGAHLWVAKSAAEWCVETDLTHEQYKDAVATLRQLGLIVTAQHRFAGKTITHLRLTEPGGALVGWWSLEALQVGGGGAWRHRPSYRNYPTGTTLQELPQYRTACCRTPEAREGRSRLSGSRKMRGRR